MVELFDGEAELSELLCGVLAASTGAAVYGDGFGFGELGLAERGERGVEDIDVECVGDVSCGELVGASDVEDDDLGGVGDE